MGALCDHGLIAPWAIVKLKLIISFGSISSFVPRPVQFGQAPWGELNEKFLGSNSGKLIPQVGQANNWEKVFSIETPVFLFVSIGAMVTKH